MGTLRSNTYHTGLAVNGITLGQPNRDTDEAGEPMGQYRWDDARFPNGVINADGTITVDDAEEF